MTHFSHFNKLFARALVCNLHDTCYAICPQVYNAGKEVAMGYPCVPYRADLSVLETLKMHEIFLEISLR